MTAGGAERFTGELADLVEITGSSVEELEHRDTFLGGVDRWCWVTAEGGIAACVSTHVRPDDRTFMRVDGDESFLDGLVELVLSDLGRPLFVSVREPERASDLSAHGFVVADVSDVFEVKFADLLVRAPDASAPAGVEIIDADHADRNALYELDVGLRRDVPGTEGWRGNRSWFDAEFEERPPYDATAYLIARKRSTGAYLGLVRFWRNDTGPRLGLIGVIPSWRRTRLAATLLRPAAEAAARWGWPSFVTETSRANRAVHPFLERLASEHVGSISLMVRRPPQH